VTLCGRVVCVTQREAYASHTAGGVRVCEQREAYERNVVLPVRVATSTAADYFGLAVAPESGTE
jgi:hypothetical protein